MYFNSDIAAIIAEVVHSKRDRDIMKLIMVDKIKYKDVAEKFDLTDNRIKQIVKKYRGDIEQFIPKS